MNSSWLAICAVTLSACTSTPRPTAPPSLTPAQSLSLPPAPVAATPEVHGPDAVRDRLFREHPHRAAIVAGLHVVEDDGAVTLLGFVPDERTGRELLATVRHVPGVRTVRNDLVALEHPRLESAGVSRTGEVIRSWLRSEQPNAVGPDETFAVYERDGIVTLRGRVIGEKAHRELVNRVKQMPDIKQVDDRLEVEDVGVDRDEPAPTMTRARP